MTGEAGGGDLSYELRPRYSTVQYSTVLGGCVTSGFGLKVGSD